MQKVNRLILVTLLTIATAGGARAMEGPAQTAKAAEYKRSDANFYPKGDVVKTHASAVIIPPSGYTRNGDSYIFIPKKKAPKEMYAEVNNDWIEPITPPGATSLGIAPDAMAIREPQGDVEVALPSAPATFFPATDGLTLPNGAVVKTGADGTAAVLFGGVDSARLMPDSEAAVQQTVTAQSRATEVDLTTGGVFSKVGTQVGVKGEYEVHTPFGNAAAQGGDFVAIISGSRTDVWVAQGTVELMQPNGKKAGMVTSDGAGPLKLIRFPSMADPRLSAQADVETLTAILNFIPLADQKVKALRDKSAQGLTLTAVEEAYLKRIKQVPALVKLALVEPAAPAAPTPPPAMASAPASEAQPKPAPPPHVQINLRQDGEVEVDGTAMSLDDFTAKLANMAKAKPAPRLLITGRENVTPDQLKKVVALCHAAKLKVKVAKTVQQGGPPSPTPVPATPASPVPSTPPTPATPSEAPSPAPASTTTTAPASQVLPTKEMGPVEIIALRSDENVDLSTMTISLNELKWRLAKMAKVNTGLSVVITGKENAPEDQLKKVLAICKSAKVKHISVAAPETAVAVPAESAPEATIPPATPPASDLKPINIAVSPNGTIKFKGKAMDLAEFQSKLKGVVKTMPNQSFVVEAGTRVPYDKIKAILDSCVDAQANNVSVDIYAEDSVPGKAKPAPSAVASMPDASSAPPSSPFPAGPAPIRAVVRVDGKINFQGATYDVPGLKSKLLAMVKATPDQSIVIHAGKTVPYEKLKEVFDCCRDANVKYTSAVTVSAVTAAPATTPPVAPVATEPAAANLPAPGLLMHSPFDSMSSNAPPMAPSGLPAPTPSPSSTADGNPPTGNAATPASP